MGNTVRAQEDFFDKQSNCPGGGILNASHTGS